MRSEESALAETIATGANIMVRGYIAAMRKVRENQGATLTFIRDGRKLTLLPFRE